MYVYVYFNITIHFLYMFLVYKYLQDPTFISEKNNLAKRLQNVRYKCVQKLTSN